MEFVINRNDLVQELQVVTGVVEKRATLPILSNLLLETGKEGVQVGASDLEVTIRGTAKATVVKPGSITLPAAKLHEIARSLDDSDIHFKLLDRNRMEITCERTRFRIAGQSRDEFPNFPEMEGAHSVELPASFLGEMIERVSFAITTEDPRYSLNGALFKLADGMLTLVATDGNRLAYVSRQLDDVTAKKIGKDEIRVIVPKKALAEAYKLTTDQDGELITFGTADKQVYFEIGGHRLTSTVLEGSFPRYDKVMPERCSIGLTLPTSDLSQAVKRVALLVTDRYGRAVRLALSAGKLQLSSETDMGDAEETIAVDYDGPEVVIGFNARFLLDFFSAVHTPSVHIELNPVGEGEEPDPSKAGDKPGQFRPEPAGEMDYRYIVMPMHL